jgi:hypothetical protein
MGLRATLTFDLDDARTKIAVGARATDLAAGFTVVAKIKSRYGVQNVLVRGRQSCEFIRSVADCRYGYPY